MDFDKIKQHISDMRTVDPAYADWARQNYARILAAFFVKGG